MIARLIERLATWSALVGGVVLCALILMTGVSILGRAAGPLGTGPVPGDFELIELGVAFVVFAFLPLAHLRGAHAVVDLATAHLPDRARAALTAFWDAVLTLALALILWRLVVGTEERLAYNDQSYLLRIPLWWAYAACIPPAIIAVLTGTLVTWRGLKGTRRTPDAPEAGT